MKKKAFVFQGGWPGHYPDVICKFAQEHFLADYEVTISDDLAALETTHLIEYDVVVPIWTVGKLTVNQEIALVTAVEQGVGMVTWHGTADAFNDNHLFKFVLGGQFICHPGDFVDYSVEFAPSDDPITAGLKSFNVSSEQYYVHVDPNNDVLATTRFAGHRYPWLEGKTCPAAWKRTWGKGHVFYHSIGHTVTELSIPEVMELTRRGFAWATRDENARHDGRPNSVRKIAKAEKRAATGETT